MQCCFKRRSLPALLGLFGFSVSALAESRWIHLRTDNFEMYSTAGEAAARETVRNFEQVRSFFAQSARSGRSDQKRVFIVGFDSEKEYAPYRLNEFASAYYHPGADRDYIVMSKVGYDTFPTAIHEYVHLVVQHLGLNFPPWFNEGYAELYSTLRPQGGKIMIGAPIAGRLQQMLQEKWTPLAAIVAADQNSPYYNEKSRAGSLYNEGWGLVHMLTLSTSYGGKTKELMGALNSGQSSQEALERIYGKPLAQIDKDLQAYVRSDTFRAALLPARLDKSKEAIPAEPASGFDVELALADLMNRPGKEKEAQERLKKLANENAARPEPWAGLAYLAWQEGRTEEARQNFDKAYSLGDREPRLLWDYGRLAEGANSERAQEVLGVLAEQAPDRLDVRLELASVQIANRQWGLGYATLQTIKNIDPENAPRLFTLLAYAQINLRAPEAAQASVDQLAKYARTDRDRQELDQLRSILSAKNSTAQNTPQNLDAPAQTSEPKPDADLEREQRPTIRRSPGLIERPVPTLPSPLPSAVGKFLELRCLGERALVILDTGDAKKTFLITDPKKIEVSGGTTDLACGAQPRTPLRVEYSQSDAPQVDGEVRALYFQK